MYRETTRRGTQAPCRRRGRHAGPYRIQQIGRRSGGPAIRVIDPLRGEVLFAWHGATARHILVSGALPCPGALDAVFPCDKSFVQRLTLIAASVNLPPDAKATRTATGDAGASRVGSGRYDRLRRLDVVPTLLHRRLTDFLFSHPGTHFSEHEIACAMLMDCPAVDPERVKSHLDDLIRAELVQRIAVTENDVFYDIDVDDHLHVFCPRTRTLEDAPSDGVVVAATR